MALNDRDILITPNKGTSTEATIAFIGANTLTSATITLHVYNSGTTGQLSFEGASGQLFSIVDSLVGTIFSVNDISGIPSIEVLDTGQIKLAQYNGYVSILGTTASTGTTSGVLQVAGGIGVGGALNVGSYISANNGIYSVGTYTGLNYTDGIVVDYVTGNGRITVGLNDGLTFYTGNYNSSTTTATVAISTVGNVTIYSTTASTSTNTGALIVKGGVGIGGSLYVGSTSFIAGAQIVTTATLGSFGNQITALIYAGTDTVVTAGTTSGSIIIYNTSTLQSVTNRGNTTTNAIIITNTDDATGPNLGALQVTGGAYVGKRLWVASTAASSSSYSSNALYVAGGIGGNSGFNINGNGFLNGNLSVYGNITGTNITVVQATGTRGVFYGDATGQGALYAGITGYTPFNQTMIQASGNNNNFMQINVQNINSGALASTDIVASADNVSVSNSFIDMGITSSGWNGSQPNSFGTAVGANDGYIYVAGNIPNTGNLALGTVTTGTQVRFIVAASGTSVSSANIAAVINKVNTPTVSTTTGVLVVYGGVGVGGGLYVNNIITASNISVTLAGDTSTAATTWAVFYNPSTKLMTTASIFVGYYGSIGYAGSRGYSGSIGYTGSI